MINDTGQANNVKNVHRKGIRLKIFDFRTSPNESILYYVGEIPLQLIRDQNSLIYGIKKKTTPDHIGYNALTNSMNPKYKVNVPQT